MSVLIVYELGGDRTWFALDDQGVVTPLPGPRPRTDRPALIAEHGCTGYRNELRPPGRFTIR